MKKGFIIFKDFIMKHFGEIIITIFLFVVFTSLVVLSFTGNVNPPQGEPSEPCDIEATYYIERKNNAHAMAEAARKLGYSEDDYIIWIAQKEWWEAQNALSKLEESKLKTETEELSTVEETIIEEPIAEEIIIDEHLLQLDKHFNEYPVAAEIWYFLTDKVCSEVVAAGIIGNIMTEVGGQTLNLNPTIYGGNYYGICQWSLYYSPQVNGMTLEQQLFHLWDTMPQEFNTFGKNYYQGFNYDAFLKIDNVYDAALAFAKCYERCSSKSYSVRQQNALTAYNYFMS